MTGNPEVMLTGANRDNLLPPVLRKLIAEIFSTVIAMPAVYRDKSIH